MKQDLSANSHNKPCWAPTQLAMCYLTLGNVFYARKMSVHLPYSSIKDALCSSECLQWLDLNGSAGKMILLLFSLFRIDSQLRQAVERQYLVIGSLLVCVIRISKHSVRKEKYQPYICSGGRMPYSSVSGVIQMADWMSWIHGGVSHCTDNAAGTVRKLPIVKLSNDLSCRVQLYFFF